MTRRWFPSLLCVTVVLSAVHFSAARNLPLRINESAIKIIFDDEQTGVTLPVENHAGRSFGARVMLALVDPQGRVRATAETEATIRPGANSLTTSLPFPASSAADRLPWYRLTYRVSPDNASSDVGPVEGIASLSEIASAIFDLRVSAPHYAFEGMRYRAHVYAAHPVSARAAKGVRLDAEIELDEEGDASPLRASSVTDADGFATLDFHLPRDIGAADARITITARRDGFARRAEDDISVQSLAEIIVTTDKPLYQPGQVLHIRMLGVDTLARRAIPDANATLKIYDPDRATVFQTTLKTSRFGVASVDWPIAETTRLGEYFIEVEIDDGKYEDATGGYRFKISRYELPSFTVNAKPNGGYYLPGQNAEVEIRADYLFGQPVKRGRVRVVRESEREWNYREQKWEAKEADEYEGELDGEGKFVAKIDLAAAHRDLAEEDSARFRDLTYAAYVTDSNTNRTEQRRFDLRVTKEAIHVYVIRSYDFAQSEKLPLEFYVSAFYADGSPARCEITVGERVAALPLPAFNLVPAKPRFRRRPLRTVSTNRFGVAKVSALRLDADASRGGEVSISLGARDRAGRTGEHDEEFELSREPVVRVAADKIFHRPGEPVRAQVVASEAEMVVTVDVLRELRVLGTQTVRLRGGRASLTIPFQKEFAGDITIAAHSNPSTLSGDSPATASRTILYPGRRDLQMDVRLDRSTYKPGEEARADFRVRTPDGSPVESALGVVVFDRAVEERARSDQEFGASRDYDFARQRLAGIGDRLAGVSRADLDRLDPTKPLPEGVELLGEIMLNRNKHVPFEFFGETFMRDAAIVFSPLYAAQLKPVRDALDASYRDGGAYPRSEEELRRVLGERGVNLDDMRDPWGAPYRAEFGVENEHDVLTLMSNAADERANTTDDFPALRVTRPYFKPLGEAVNRALLRRHARDGGFIRDRDALRSELIREGVDFDNLRDRWGRPYDWRFGVRGTDFTVTARSGGANGRFEPDAASSGDDFTIWTANINYFAGPRAALDAAIGRHVEAGKMFPQNEAELRSLLRSAGLDEALLRDVWGRPYQLDFKNRSWNAEHVVIRSYASYREKPKDRADKTPVKHVVNSITLRSPGEDGKAGTFDDFEAANFWRLSPPEPMPAFKPQHPPGTPSEVTPTETIGALHGIVFDANGAVIPGAFVKVSFSGSGEMREATSSDEGIFFFDKLSPGTYELRIDVVGFKSLVVTDIPVHPAKVTELEAALEPGAVTETVSVTAESVHLQTEATASSMVVDLPVIGRKIAALTLNPGAAEARRREQVSTPRLREHFTETLVWQPQIETDGDGRAQLRFKLADNITTWKMSVVGSTLDGQIGVAEKEIRAFQPFFVEHDPPPTLTEGDEISLPVVVRNYLDKPQTVDLDLTPENWFAPRGATRQRAEVAAGDAARVTFDFRAVASVRSGKQRVTAAGSEASDAIEKTINVRPDGEEVAETTGQIFGDIGALNLHVPANALPGTLRAEMKIYPNLLAHVIEGVEGIMQRPYGCGEQTISSTYPSLLVLRHYRRHGDGQLPPVARQAQRYVQSGYERLLGYRAAGGGFSYWGGGEADPALTAYALKFLHDAREFVAVDEGVAEAARAWLVKQQLAAGSWPSRSSGSKESESRNAMRTSFIARVFAATKTAGGVVSDDNAARGDAPKAGQDASSIALRRALNYLSLRADQIKEPYFLASAALAALDEGDTSGAARLLANLRTLVREEGGTAYWDVKTETPFHGWGDAGRIEATALAVAALRRWQTSTPQLPAKNERTPASEAGDAEASPRASDENLISRAALFLLRRKDRYGVWHSTQATVNVLDALNALSSPGASNAGRPAATQKDQEGLAEIFVNGRRATTTHIHSGAQLIAPTTLDLSGFLASPGDNRIEIRRARGLAQPSAVQVIVTYYRPWPGVAAAGTEPRTEDAAKPLHLDIAFDKTEAEIGQEITCRVGAKRRGFGGSGMLLAEIGLPPGADVDRQSLDRAMKESDGSVSHYDVLPDRLVVYLWPHEGGTKFEFKFRPRFGLNAQSAPSLLYDYYNPEARAVVPPTRFVVR